MKLEEAKKILSDAGYIVEGSMSLEDKILHAKLHIEYDGTNNAYRFWNVYLED